jgi:drug/metabolite transporter (DMT)-like permease
MAVLLATVLVTLWYASGIAFSVALKLCAPHDLLFLTSVQLAAGVCLLCGGSALFGRTSSLLEGAAAAPRRLVLASGALFLGGTVLTNASLLLLSVGFAHTLKACEPIVTVVLLCATGERVGATNVLAVLCIVSGVLVTASTQGAVNLSGVLCGLLSNVCLQARNLVNKRLMGQGEKGALSPNQLLSVSFLLALSIQLPIHALFVVARGEQAASPGSERDGLVWAWRWHLLTGGAFVVYQLCSIHVLSHVRPLVHAVINTLRRAVIIGISALLLGEHVSGTYFCGIAVALVGVLALSLSKHVQLARDQWALRLGLFALLLLASPMILRKHHLLGLAAPHEARQGAGRLEPPLPPPPRPPPLRTLRTSHGVHSHVRQLSPSSSVHARHMLRTKNEREGTAKTKPHSPSPPSPSPLAARLGSPPSPIPDSCRDAGSARVRCSPAELVKGALPWVLQPGSGPKAEHRIRRCRIVDGTNCDAEADLPPLSVMHVGAYDNNVGDNLALDHVQHHIASTLLPYRGSRTAIYHLLDIDHFFISRGNDIKGTLRIFSDLARALNVSLLVFGGGGLVQPGYAHTKTKWRLPLNALITSRMPMPYVVYGVGVNVFRSSSALQAGGSSANALLEAFTTAERDAMRVGILNALSFSVRNDGSHAALLSLYPRDATVRNKVWEIADPGMMLPFEHCSLARPTLPLARPTSTALPSGWMALQPAWNAKPAVNKGRMGPADIAALVRFVVASRPIFIPHTGAKDYKLFDQLYRSAGAGATKIRRGNAVSGPWFKQHIHFGAHGELLTSLYGNASAFDSAVVMRGHGLYLCVALNIPCIALSTQDKVSGFARLCGFEQYLVDVSEDRQWERTLTSAFSRLQNDVSFRDGWHRKRAACVHHWSGVSGRYHEDVHARFVSHRGRRGGEAPSGPTSVAAPRPSRTGKGQHDHSLACGSAAMQQQTRQSELLKRPLPVGLNDSLEELQVVAERQWKAGMKDRNGRRDPILGSIRSDPAALRYYFDAASDPAVRTICEVGYNWGASSLVWLHANAAARVVAFDLSERAYTNATFAWLNRRYRNRLTLIRGDSTVTIPAFADGAYGGERDQTACDLVLVDGDHSYKGELENVLHFRRLARCGEGSKYIMDDCSCRKRALPTTRAWTEAVRQGAIVPQAGHRTSRVYRASQGFRDYNEEHTYCAGTLRPPEGHKRCEHRLGAERPGGLRS